MLFLVETTCFVPPVAQCLRFGSCHRLERCYRPTVCPADRGLCCLQLPYTCVLSLSYVSLPAIPLPGVLYLMSLCSITVSFPVPRFVTPSLLYCDVGRHLGSVRMSHICLASFRLQPGRDYALISNFYASMKAGSVLHPFSYQRDKCVQLHESICRTAANHIYPE